MLYEYFTEIKRMQTRTTRLRPPPPPPHRRPIRARARNVFEIKLKMIMMMMIKTTTMMMNDDSWCWNIIAQSRQLMWKWTWLLTIWGGSEIYCGLFSQSHALKSNANLADTRTDIKADITAMQGKENPVGSIAQETHQYVGPYRLEKTLGKGQTGGSF